MDLVTVDRWGSCERIEGKFNLHRKPFANKIQF